VQEKIENLEKRYAKKKKRIRDPLSYHYLRERIE